MSTGPERQFFCQIADPRDKSCPLLAIAGLLKQVETGQGRGRTLPDYYALRSTNSKLGCAGEMTSKQAQPVTNL